METKKYKKSDLIILGSSFGAAASTSIYILDMIVPWTNAAGRVLAGSPEIIGISLLAVAVTYIAKNI